MTIKLASLKADLDRETKGDWVDFPDIPGLRLKVSSLFKPEYTTARDITLKRLAAVYKADAIPQPVLSAELGGLYAKHILHGWEGLDIDYSEAAAEKYLTDPAYRVLVGAVEWCAGKIAETRIEYVEKDTKNSGKPSAGA
ncbi:hypothetical protein GOZ97_07395 [Agrobacterium vitis]|uniref:hypothetical protein n=1 Tax=Agrobacterium vitis TaxID=373 RepID=UPI0008FAEDB4|nr:hypothetical protein [Agrobacterium vitis]MUZ53023.1 hypothetical protein [Agrobacterium vitis]MUZ91242.1 hypothetical protein [Agrobacterium vitis]MVA40314.1 hypothetical protein [Agrobacterium vitis]NSX96160.1 hypothetical protein [Agrobacterium vitis]NSZ27299.1 hypothetical protein [Agrobacterium vitis]